MRSSDVVESKVAVKVLRRDVDPNSQAVSRLRDEARLLGSLNHPHILQIFDLIELGGRAALVTEYIPGADLTDLAGQIPPRTALEIGARIADALEAAWTTIGKNGQPIRLIHRDIKPSNIRLGQHGEVKLLDFGIAHSDSPDRESRTQTQKLIGSFDYMAPERLAQREVGTSADVYSLGCTLYETLAGTGLFQGMTVRRHLVYAHSESRHTELVDEAIQRLSAPDDVLATLKEMLAYAPGLRPPLAELEERLQETAQRLPSADLRTWARSRAWNPPHAVEGDLVGATLSEPVADAWIGTALPAETRPTRRSFAAPIAAGVATALLVSVVAALATALPDWLESDPSTEPLPEVQPIVEHTEPEPEITTPTPPPPQPVAPDPKPPARPSATRPRAKTRFWVSGAASSVELVRDGQRFPPGEIPPGRYAIEAVFSNTQMGMTQVGEVVIEAGENVEIKCRPGFFACSR